jgi:hypothetical protein
MTTSRSPKRWNSRIDDHQADLAALILITIDVAVLTLLTFLFAQGWLQIASPLYLS